jgi:hypothetical protein
MAWHDTPMTTFIVHLPAEDRHRLHMFEQGAVERVPTPQLVSLRADREIRLVRASFRTIGKMAKMFPDWQFQALLSA